MFSDLLVIAAAVIWCCFRNQKCELERRQSSGLYRAKAYDKMKYRIRDGPWVKCSYVVSSYLIDHVMLINLAS